MTRTKRPTPTPSDADKRPADKAAKRRRRAQVNARLDALAAHAKAAPPSYAVAARQRWFLAAYVRLGELKAHALAAARRQRRQAADARLERQAADARRQAYGDAGPH